MVVGINLKENVAKTNGFVKKHGLSFPIAMDKNGAFFNRFGQRGIPTNVLIQPDGTIAYIRAGFDSRGIEETIPKILPEDGGKKPEEGSDK